VWVAPVGPGQPKQLTFDRELMGFPCWSPDGRWLAFQMQRGADTHIVVMPSEGGPVTPLTSAPGQSWAHGWAPDGDRIAFAGLRGGYWNVYWVSRTTKRVRQVTSYHALNIFVRYPAWSPRNDRIVYELSEASGNVWVMDLAPSSSPPAPSR
jgi:Tol biopolymer transport system component